MRSCDNDIAFTDIHFVIYVPFWLSCSSICINEKFISNSLRYHWNVTQRCCYLNRTIMINRDISFLFQKLSLLVTKVIGLSSVCF